MQLPWIAFIRNSNFLLRNESFLCLASFKWKKPPTLQKDYVKNDVVVEKNPESGIGMWNVTKKHFVDNSPVKYLYSLLLMLHFWLVNEMLHLFVSGKLLIIGLLLSLFNKASTEMSKPHGGVSGLVICLGVLWAFQSQPVNSNPWPTFVRAVPWKMVRTELVPAGVAACASRVQGRVCVKAAVPTDLFSLHGFQFTSYFQKCDHWNTLWGPGWIPSVNDCDVCVWLGAALMGLSCTSAVSAVPLPLSCTCGTWGRAPVASSLSSQREFPPCLAARLPPSKSK